MANDKQLAGVYSGKLVPQARGFTLTRYSVARGVQLSGTFKLVNTDLPFSFLPALGFLRHPFFDALELLLHLGLRGL